MGVQSNLERIGIESRDHQINDYLKGKEYRGTSEDSRLDKVSEGITDHLKSNLGHINHEIRVDIENSTPSSKWVNTLDKPFDEFYEYDERYAEKGNPSINGDAGYNRILTTQSRQTPSDLFGVEIDTAGSKEDRFQRDSLEKKNKYGKVYEYSSKNIDTRLNEEDGQFYTRIVKRTAAPRAIDKLGK